jgi:predicted RNA-binding protein with PIN domain
MPSALDLAKLEDQRWYLVRFIEQHRPQGSMNNRVTVVFDGNTDVYGGMRSTTVKVVFSQGEPADDTIRKIVEQAENTKDIVVVSDDRDIQYAVRALGAKTVGTLVFLGKVRDPKRTDSRKGPSPERERYISKNDEFKITSEFSRIWLDPKRKQGK